MTEERVTIRSVTKTDGGKILKLVIGENPLFAPVICVEASGISYKMNSLEDILQGLGSVYGRYKELKRGLEKREFIF